jgi:hypothetical protein
LIVLVLRSGFTSTPDLIKYCQNFNVLYEVYSHAQTSIDPEPTTPYAHISTIYAVLHGTGFFTDPNSRISRLSKWYQILVETNLWTRVSSLIPQYKFHQSPHTAHDDSDDFKWKQTMQLGPIVWLATSPPCSRPPWCCGT